MTQKVSSNRRISITAAIGIICLVFALLYAPAFFYSKASGRKAPVDQGRPENYDIRRDKGSFGKIAELRGRSGRSAVSVADARDEFVRGESALKARVPSLKVEYH